MVLKKEITVSIISIITFASIAGIFLFSQIKQAKEARAGTGHNVSGWAWSNMQNPATPEDERTILWLSFNSTNCDTDNNGYTDSGLCGGDNSTTQIQNYGVNIDSNGILSGYAYYYINDPNTLTYETGWLSFNRLDTGSPPALPDYNTHLAEINFGNREVFGWARALNACDSLPCVSSGPCSNCGGWDGWIKFRKDSSDSGSDYGVWIDTAGDFHGWAWGSNIIGWLSFNCYNDYNNDGILESHCFDAGYLTDYKVVTSGLNQPPQVQDIQEPDNSEFYCTDSPGLGRVSFQWTYYDPDGDLESGYDFQIATSSDFSNLVVNIECRTSDCLGDPINNPNTDGVNIVINPGAQQLSYGQFYYWQVKVYDNAGNNSGWVFDQLNPLFSFTTDSHAWPWSYFEFSLANPRRNETVNFSDTSFSDPNTYAFCYDNANNQYPCKDQVNDYYWAFGDGETATGTPLATTTHKYLSQGSYQASLRITDYLNPSYSCEKTLTVQVLSDILFPRWEEIPPF